MIPKHSIEEAAVHTPFGKVITTLLDGELAWKLECPGCGKWALLDEDQLHGRVSVDHTDTGCSYHETHDFAAELNRIGASQARTIPRRFRGGA